MTADELKQRTKKFAIEVIRASAKLSGSVEGKVIRQQIVRSGTSVGANYRAACRARTKKEFIAKLGIVEEEADETMYWLEIAAETKLISREQLLAIVVASIRSAKTTPQSAIRNPRSAIKRLGGRS